MIKSMELGDLEWVRKERNRPECMMWFRQPLPISQSQQQRWFNETDMLSYIVLDDDGDRVGVVSLSKIDHIARKCEFSIMIIPELRNKGYGKKALFELLGIAFDNLNMEQVYSDVFDQNPVLEHYYKWGFVRVGNLPNWYFKNGRYVSSTIITMDKDEYNRLKSSVSNADSIDSTRVNDTAEISSLQ
jgi:RimJ/RimL family protein N-acetyltransferase